MRGGEKVLECCEMYPDADIYTHVYDEKTYPILLNANVFTTFISRLPLAKKLYKLYLPQCQLHSSYYI